MSEIMLGVLEMPEEMFFDPDPLVRRQHNAIRLEAATAIGQLQQQNRELEARVARLISGLCDLTAESISHEALDKIREMLNESPEVSLAEIEAAQEIESLAGKSPVEALLYTSTDRMLQLHIRKDDLLAYLNREMRTNYKRQHIDNWLAGRKVTPGRVKSIARRDAIRYLFGDDVADKLSGLL